MLERVLTKKRKSSGIQKSEGDKMDLGSKENERVAETEEEKMSPELKKKKEKALEGNEVSFPRNF